MCAAMAFFEALNISISTSFLGHIFGQFCELKFEVLPRWAGAWEAKRGEGWVVGALPRGASLGLMMAGLPKRPKTATRTPDGT